MVSVCVRVPGLDPAASAELAPGEGALFGRFPSVSRLLLDVPVERLAPITVASPHVSANHVAVWCTVDGVSVRDLTSRNGSWVKLSPRHTFRIASGDVHLDLAVSAEATSAVPKLAPDPGWISSVDFGVSIVTAVTAWFAARGFDAGVTLAPRDGSQFRRFPLADGATLTIASRGTETLDIRLPAILDELSAYIHEQNALLDQELGHDPDFVLRSALFRDAHRRVFEAAVRGRRLLLLGASGTGKERLAECYHRHSARREGPFKAVNCALMEKDLLWVQLFGATRGSFTGAVRDIPGAVATANGGTLFLDEIGELGAPVQAALLRFLDRKGEYERLGDTRTQRSDVQIVCATNGDLRDAIARGTFREDLWYRFAGTVVHVPLLRERPEDVLGYLETHTVFEGISARHALSPEALDAVLAHAWPGNFRELENFVARLPSIRQPGAIHVRTCQAALTEGATRLKSEPLVTVDSLTSSVGVSSAWDEAVARASTAWREDHDGLAPATLGALKDWLEGYLKPVLAAQTAGIDKAPELAAAINYSALGRQLDVGDGSTVKRWIERYLSRFGPRI